MAVGRYRWLTWRCGLQTQPLLFRCSCQINIPASYHGTSTPTRLYIIYTLVVSFVVPVTLISTFYAILVIELQRRRLSNRHAATQRRLPAAASAAGCGGQKMRARKITWLVTTVVVVYVVCWLPYWIFQVILAGIWYRSRRLGLQMASRVETHQVTSCLGLVSVSATCVSCPRRYFAQILQSHINKMSRAVAINNLRQC